MVSATLAFGRDARTGEAVSALDLAELLRTLLDEAAMHGPRRRRGWTTRDPRI